jgi:hypothetical protein
LDSHRFHRILINAAIVCVCITFLPPPSGLIVGALIAIGFTIYLNSKESRRKATPPTRQDIWQRNARRLQLRRNAQANGLTSPQQQRMVNAFPWAAGFTVCLTLAAVSYFQLGFVGFIFLFIAIFLAVTLYAIHRIQTT